MKTTICALVFALSSQFLAAQSHPQPRLVIRSGLVEVQRGNMWKPITMGEFINAGESIRTASGSMAAIEIAPDRVVTLNESSQIQLGSSTAAPIVQLDAGSMKVFAGPGDILVAAKDTLLETAERPLDMELGFESDKLSVTVFSGAVRNGSMTIRGGNQDPTVRTYTAGGRMRDRQPGVPIENFYPYFLYSNPDPNAGRIVPPVVNNPTNPGYRPTQIVPPMSDPIRVPVTK